MKKLFYIIFIIFEILAILAAVVLLFGTFTNWPMYVGGYASLFESHYSVQIFLTAILLFCFTFLIYRVKRAGLTKFFVIFFSVIFIGQSAVLIKIYHQASSNDLSLSFIKALKIDFGEKPKPDETCSFLTLNGKEYLLDVYRPAKNTKLSIPLILVHGGGYVEGSRTYDRHQYWFTDRGLTVFDVDYPLATDSMQTWESAANTVATSISFIMENADKYHLDTTQLILCGGSAGGGLVMQVGYGLGNGNVTSYSVTRPKIPTAIIAIYPPVDLTGMWNTAPGEMLDLEPVARQYIGGSPDEYPERYAKLNMVNSLREGLPKTFIIAGTYDHVVPVRGSRKLVKESRKLQQPIQFLEVPFGEHYFDGNANSLSAQIKWQAMEKFLKENHFINQ
ncbi:MAG: alpha/beta hydrolase [Bacteroidales bacterium]